MADILEFKDGEEAEIWVTFADTALGRIITVVPLSAASLVGSTEPVIAVHPRADQDGGAADLAARYADAMLIEFRKRMGED